MVKRRKKTKDPLSRFQGLSTGLAKTGVTFGVGAAVAGRAATMAPTASIGSSFPLAASFVPIATTAGAGGIALDAVRKLKRKKRLHKR